MIVQYVTEKIGIIVVISANHLPVDYIHVYLVPITAKKRLQNLQKMVDTNYSKTTTLIKTSRHFENSY